MAAIRRFMLARKKEAMQAKQQEFVRDDYGVAETSAGEVRGKTGVVFDDYNILHKCDWDTDHPECPERYLRILERCKELGLIERCELLSPERYDISKIFTVHSSDHFENLEKICNLEIAKREEQASRCDSVYFNKHTPEAALRSLSCVLTLVNSILTQKVQNGFAFVRPPGHHAGKNEFNGYCFINNVAVAAKEALNSGLVNRILVVDFDVHHGQGVQDAFYHTNQVLYFSIHRYENGTFWPNLKRSNSNYTGAGRGFGYNINVPLNTIGLGDKDYVAILHHILLPVAYEYQPELIIVAAGYDASIGCFEGKMKVSPGFYGHLISLLSGLAKGKIAVCLEGGYFLPSLAEGAAMTLRSLLGDSVADLGPLERPHEEVIKTINDLKYYLRPNWQSFRHTTVINLTKPLYVPCEVFNGIADTPPYPTRKGYPEHEPGAIETNTKVIEILRAQYEEIPYNQKVCFASDAVCLEHRPQKNIAVKDAPQRLLAAQEKFAEWNLDKRCFKLELLEFDLKWVTAVHDTAYVEKVMAQQIESTNDIFSCEKTPDAIKACVTSVVTVVDNILSNKYNSGVALIRPPGHHAEKDAAKGFCFINNVAIAAQYALDKFKLDRVMIIDFDAHHGNGTQHAFYDTNKVLFLSVHRYENGKYFPHSIEADCAYIGNGDGEGYNINIPLNDHIMEDTDYIQVFHRIILPAAYAYNPELVLISAGFDCGINDPVGGYKVTPQAFGHFVQMIRSFARGKVVVVPEGGYNPTTFATCLCMCVKALLGDPLPPLELYGPSKDSVAISLAKVIDAHRKFWGQLDIDKKIQLSPDHEEIDYEIN